MKKLIVVIFLSAFFTTSYSQEQKTPTKLETMDWIAGKMKKYLRNGNVRFFTSYSGGIFIYERLVKGCENGIVATSKVIIDLNKVGSYDICGANATVEPNSSNSCWHSFIRGNNMVYTVTTNRSTGRTKSTYDNSIRIDGDLDDDPCSESDNYNDFSLFNFDLEDGLFLRLQKALKALIKYNTVKTDEIY